MAPTDAPSVTTVVRVSKRRTSSSNTKTAPPMGARQCRSKTSPAPQREHLAVTPVAAKYTPRNLAGLLPSAHSVLRDRALGRADCEHATDGLHRYQAIRCLWQRSAEDRLDVGNAASFRLWRETANEPSGYRGAPAQATTTSKKPTNLSPCAQAISVSRKRSV